MNKTIKLNGQTIEFDPQLATFRLINGDDDLFFTAESCWPRVLYESIETRKTIRIPCVLPQYGEQVIVAVFDLTCIFWSTIRPSKSLQTLTNGKTFLSCTNVNVYGTPKSEGGFDYHKKGQLNEIRAVDKASMPRRITEIICPKIDDYEQHEGQIIFGKWKVKARFKLDRLVGKEIQNMVALKQIDTKELIGQKPETKPAANKNEPCPICRWFHDSDFTSFSVSTLPHAIIIKHGTDQWRYIKAVHEHMEQYERAAISSMALQKMGFHNYPSEMFRYCAPGFIRRTNHGIVIVPPNEYTPRLRPQKPRQKNHAKNRKKHRN